MSSESDSTTSNIDSEAIDETYNLSSKDIETLVADDLLAQEMADDLVKKSTKRSLAGKRKDNENTLKIQVAEEVGKHPNLFDINNKNYMNRSKDSESWNAVSTNVGIDVSKCKAIWESLKRGARYHGKATKMPYKSGAGTDDPDVCSKKKRIGNLVTQWRFIHRHHCGQQKLWFRCLTKKHQHQLIYLQAMMLHLIVLLMIHRMYQWLLRRVKVYT